MASLMNLGCVDMIFVDKFDSSGFLVRSVTFRSNLNSFKTVRKVNRESHACACVRNYSATPDYSGINDTKNNNNGGVHRRIARRSILNSRPNEEPLVSMPWHESQPSRNSGNEKLSDGAEMSMSVDSLGEVLAKVEKNLKTGMKASLSKNEPSSPRHIQKSRKPVNSVNGPKGKVKTLKSVWQRGSSVATVKKVIKERMKPGIRTDEGQSAASQSLLPANVQPKVQRKPFAKEPMHLKDVNSADIPPDGNRTNSVKLRKPILVDKFSSKKPVIDPLIAQAVVPPPKLSRRLTPMKFKDKYRNKGSTSEGHRRRIIDNDGKFHEEDTEELNVPIPGAGVAPKGRKWTKARRRAIKRQEARDAMPARVEIMEVGEHGMLTEDLAYNLAISEGEILGYLYSKGIKPDGVQKLSHDMVKIVCKDYGVEVVDAVPTEFAEMAKKKEIFDDGDLEQLENRHPVLTIMGHVDHGKTTLLDYIRKSKVAAGEAGGITQGIGAYNVQVPLDGETRTCVFLDTPGHEAFGAMRARGARVTDIAVIVVAADEGIQPQTNEAIAHAKAAGVPIVIAINKIDKNGANPDRVMQDLSSVGLMPEDWGGDIPMVKISALKGENVDELLETIMLVAELQELKANPHRHAKGTVIEAGLNKAKGPVATFIVQNGTIRKGDVIVCGEAFGKVRALFDDSGKHVDEAGPSTPVQVLGLNNVPLAGDEFEVVDSLAIAREKAEGRAEYLRNEHIMEKAGNGKVTLATLASAISLGENSGLDLHELNIILKVDVQGSIEAIRQALEVLPHDNVTLKFLLQATGDVCKSDIDLAVASKAVIFGFNVKAPGSVKSYAENKRVEIRSYRVIYELIDDVENTMEGLLDLVQEQVQIGSAEVRAVFSSGSSRVAGCMVTEGKLVRECGIRVIRKGKEVHVGVLDSLRRVREIVKEVPAGLECGIGSEGFGDWEAGDMIEAFNTVQKRRTLAEASATMSAALKQVGMQL